jgi:predicted nucleic acid-binding protein
MGRRFGTNAFRLMEKAIFDTSVWINFSKGIENPQTLKLEDYLTNYPKQVYITPTIIQEFLMGLRFETDFVKYQFQFYYLNSFKSDWENISIAAAKLYFDLREKGITVRKSTDCLIAQIAIKNDVLLVHLDSDFELIANNSSLRTF